MYSIQVLRYADVYLPRRSTNNVIKQPMGNDAQLAGRLHKEGET